MPTLREVVELHRHDCFVDTDRITRDADRMLQLVAAWTANRSDAQAGVTRNHAFNPALPVVVSPAGRIVYAPHAGPPGEPSLLYTIVPPDRPSK